MYPHAHHLARQVEGFATLPDGTQRALIEIKDWDFNWQDDYRYVTPVHLPLGTMVVMRYTYDNSSANIRNPYNPPQRVRFGPRSTDEMAELMLQIVPTDAAALDELRRDVSAKLQRDVIAGLQALLTENPADYLSHTELAVQYVEAGELERGIAHLEEAIAVKADFADAHYNLGSALSARGRNEEAIAHYRRAIEIKPDYAHAHNNLGAMLQVTGQIEEAVMQYRLTLQFDPRHDGAHYNLANILQSQGQVGEAISHYRLALSIYPDDAAVHNNLGQALATQGNRREALEHYRAALRSQPDLLAPMNNLAWLLATSPEAELRDPAEAVLFAERAAGLTGHQDVMVLDSLAAAYAGLGDSSRPSVRLSRPSSWPAAPTRRTLRRPSASGCSCICSTSRSGSRRHETPRRTSWHVEEPMANLRVMT